MLLIKRCLNNSINVEMLKNLVLEVSIYFYFTQMIIYYFSIDTLLLTCLVPSERAFILLSCDNATLTQMR
jgi:hypothetical protein